MEIFNENTKLVSSMVAISEEYFQDTRPYFIFCALHVEINLLADISTWTFAVFKLFK